jgi:hypothetical protein
MFNFLASDKFTHSLNRLAPLYREMIVRMLSTFERLRIGFIGGN